MAKKIVKWDPENEFGPVGKTIEEILNHAGKLDVGTIIGAIQFQIIQKWKALGSTSVTDTEKRFCAVILLEAEVANGGFDQYFHNFGYEAQTALAGLKEMNAFELHCILERAMSIFDNGTVPQDAVTREAIIEKVHDKAISLWRMCDTKFYNCYQGRLEPIENMLLAYAKRKKTEFSFNSNLLT
jgi:hypothetical protein